MWVASPSCASYLAARLPYVPLETVPNRTDDLRLTRFLAHPSPEKLSYFLDDGQPVPRPSGWSVNAYPV